MSRLLRRRLFLHPLEDRVTPSVSLLKDINTVTASVVGSQPHAFTEVGALTFFRASTAPTGFELWKTDGTSTGTALVRDLNPGPMYGLPNTIGAATHANYMVNLNGTLIFRANTPELGFSLWKSDGTAGGTVPVTTTAFAPRYLTNVNGTLYFVGTDSTSGGELWKSDGTSSGTMLVKDIHPGTTSSFIDKLIRVGSELYFFANDGTAGKELWASNGTSSGTRLVRDIRPGGSTSITTTFLADVGGVAYFAADDGGTNGTELWKSDGTSTGTLLVKDIRPGILNSDSNLGFNFNGKLLFHANDGATGRELWISDGTSSGTNLLIDIRAGLSSSYPAFGASGILGTELIFSANNSTNGHELWKTDGTTTTLLRDIVPGSGESLPIFFTRLGSRVYFQANTAAAGSELWSTDGTSSGTALLAEINSGATASIPRDLALSSGKIYFTAFDTVRGYELFATDGTSSGTQLIADIAVNTIGSAPRELTTVGGAVFFRANTGTIGYELWKSDGTAAGTVLVADISPGPNSGNPRYMVNVNGTLYFQANTANGFELWKSDGTSSGTVLVRDIIPGLVSGNPKYLSNVNGTLLFTANDGINGVELWRSDGTSSGTTIVRDILPGTGSSSVGNPAVINNLLYFSATNGTSGNELWRSDGTSSGTVLVSDIRPGDSFPRYFTNAAGTVFFRANGGDGNELWKTDGTSAGTMLVRDIRPGATGSDPAELVAVGSSVFFRANDGLLGEELWKSDGTSAGTVLLREILAGTASPGVTNLTNVGSVLFFRANNGNTGAELWASDGTSAGTRLVRDIQPGSPTQTSNPSSFFNLNGLLLFRANDGVLGNEIWRSDGTSTGTALWEEMTVGSTEFTPTPANFAVAGGTLFFTANNGSTGEELWKRDGGLPPAFTSFGGSQEGVVSVLENSRVAGGITAVDLNGDAVAITIVGGPDAAAFTFDNGVLRFVNPPDFESPADADGNNTYTVTLQAAAGGDLDTQTLTFIVIDRIHAQAAVYVDDDWSLLADGTAIVDADPSQAGDQPATIGDDAFAVIDWAIDRVAADASVIVLPGSFTQPVHSNFPLALRVNSGTATVSGTVSGSQGLRKTGSGTLALTAANSFNGGSTVERGTLAVSTDAALGTDDVTVEPLGTMSFTASTTTSRTFTLLNGSLVVNGGVTLTLANASIGGGFLKGPGTIATTATGSATFIGNQSSNSLTILANGDDSFTGFTNNAALTTAVAHTVALGDFTNASGGRLTLAGTTIASDFISNGQAAVTGNFSNTGPGGLVLGGGSVTTIAAAAMLNIGSVNALVSGGLVKNSGSFGGTGTVIVDFNGRVQGSGVFGAVITRNGGVFAPGSSPGTATTNQFQVTGGGRLEFEVTNASGTAGQLNGWDLVKVQPTIFGSSGHVLLASTSINKYTLLLNSRQVTGDGNTPGNAANFNGALHYAWKFSDASHADSSIDGSFDPAAFHVDTVGFSNAFTGGFSVELRDAGRNLYVVYTPVAGPMVSSLIVNSGAAQRSRVTEIQVNLSTPVDAATIGAITLTRDATVVSTAAAGANGRILVAPLSGLVSSITLTFDNADGSAVTSGVEHGSLADGAWTLTIPSLNFQGEVHRLFGDVNGDRTIDGATDFAQFGSVFGATMANSPFDFNSDGTIDGANDFAAFGARFGTTV